MGWLSKTWKSIKKPVWGAVKGAAVGFATGGVAGAIIGGVTGTAAGIAQHEQDRDQKKALERAQVEAQKIATMQNQIVRAEEAPVATNDNAILSEESTASAKRRAFGFAKTRRSGSVARRNTLG